MEDPGYPVYRPLLVYNTVMGVVYLTVGLLAWFDVRRGAYAAGLIFLLNSVVLGIVGYLYLQQAGVAVESVRAMTLRTVAWLALFLGLLWPSAHRNGNQPRNARVKP